MISTKGKMFLIMSVFGTTGFFARYIPMPTATVALLCCLIGVATTLVMMKFTDRKLRWRHIKKSFLKMLVSGVALGAGWLLLMESHKYKPDGLPTTVYYLAPIALILLASLVGEKIVWKRLVSGVIALTGIAFMAGILENGLALNWGVLFALGAAILYVVVILCNKTLPNVSSYSKTVIQLSTAAVVMLVYCLFTGGFTVGRLGGRALMAIVILGVVHMGFTYRLFFSEIVDSKIQSVAMFSYINPAVAVFVSALMLKQKLSAGELIGVAAILGGVMFSEMLGEKMGRLFHKKG